MEETYIVKPRISHHANPFGPHGLNTLAERRLCNAHGHIPTLRHIPIVGAELAGQYPFYAGRRRGVNEGILRLFRGAPAHDNQQRILVGKGTAQKSGIVVGALEDFDGGVCWNAVFGFQTREGGDVKPVLGD